jgi:hypothetical protein
MPSWPPCAPLKPSALKMALLAERFLRRAPPLRADFLDAVLRPVDCVLRAFFADLRARLRPPFLAPPRFAARLRPPFFAALRPPFFAPPLRARLRPPALRATMPAFDFLLAAFLLRFAAISVNPL